MNRKYFAAAAAILAVAFAVLWIAYGRNNSTEAFSLTSASAQPP